MWQPWHSPTSMSTFWWFDRCTWIYVACEDWQSKVLGGVFFFLSNFTFHTPHTFHFGVIISGSATTIMSRPTPHRTPLRRISQGSLFALSRSQSYPDAPHGLGFLEPAMSELADEAETLQANLDGLKNLSDSLKSFNESFASWLYVMNMNALTTDWPQVRGWQHQLWAVWCWLRVYRRLQTRRFNWHSEERVLFAISPPSCVIMTNNVRRGRCQSCFGCDTKPSNALRRYGQDHGDRYNRTRCSQYHNCNRTFWGFWQIGGEDGEEKGC